MVSICKYLKQQGKMFYYILILCCLFTCTLYQDLPIINFSLLSTTRYAVRTISEKICVLTDRKNKFYRYWKK